MRNILLSLVFTFILSGCATTSSPLPEGYAGPTATIKDSVTTFSSEKADFFFASQVNGKSIDNSLIKTRQVNYGRGLQMTPEVISRQVPITPIVVTIVGRTEYAAPILAFTNDVYEVKGDISFTPEANQIYSVYGELGENYSTVWLEDESNQRVVGNKIEIHGSAKLGIFQK